MQRFFSTQYPRRQDQVGKTQNVIRMQVDAERLYFTFQRKIALERG
jgi:hypothetical protein